MSYAAANGGSVAYRTCGEGPPDLVLVSDWFSHAERMWDVDSPFLEVLEPLADLGRLITFDQRGVGLSDPVSLDELPTLEEWVEDVRAVLDATAAGPAWVIGKGSGAPMAMVFAATHPDAVAGLVLVNGWARLSWAPDHPAGIRPADQGRMLEHPYGPPGAVEALAGEPVTAELVDWWDRYLRNAASPTTAITMRRWLFEVDVRSILGAVTCPVLVLARRDAFTGRAHAVHLAEHLPDARLVELPGAADLLFAGDTETLVGHFADFVTGTPAAPRTERSLATVLYTDVVGSTSTAGRLGDGRWRALLDRHDAAVRETLRQCGGREVKHTGDGFLATFDGPARAIRCALLVRERVGALGVPIREGIHTGEVEHRGGDIGGIAVHIGARVQAAAEPGEILVSRTVRDLVAGSGITLRDAGTHQLKGIDEAWQLYAVDTGPPGATARPFPART
ncbi:MAG: alpha/beta fold hydrolase [Microthrixaceae bacterium]